MPAGRFAKRLRAAARPFTRMPRRDSITRTASWDPRQFVNPVGEGADPHVVRDGGRYLWCQSEGNVGVAIWVSDRLTTMGVKHVVWWAPLEGPWSKEVWAPELHHLDDRWYVYFAASDGRNRNHLTYVLVSRDDDPLGTYDVVGPLWTGAGETGVGENLWSIDLTVLEHDGRRYGVWSGWPSRDRDLQHLYAAELTSPTEITGPRVLLCANDTYDWERIAESRRSRGLHEGPQVLQRDGRTFLLYSCAASWLPTYKLGMLELSGDDPLDPACWTKHPEPLFVGTEQTYGVGHGSFVREQTEDWWHVYHAKRQPRAGWERGLFVQPMDWATNGFPDLGSPVAPHEPIGVPTGTPQRSISDSLVLTFDRASSLDGFDYYGHHQFYALGQSGLDLGIVPVAPINDYRSGEKLVLRDGVYDDVRVRAEFRVVDGDRAVGVLLRVQGCAVGYDAQRGYFAGVSARRRMLTIGRTDGHAWTELATAPLPGSVGAVRLDVTVQSHTLTARVEAGGGTAQVSVVDGTYAAGSVGLRVVDTHARFTALTAHPL